MSFDAGALLFKIQAAGAQVFQQDLKQAEQAVTKTGAAAKDAQGKTDEFGNATDRTGKKARDAKKPLDDQAASTKQVGDENRRADPEVKKATASAEKQAETARRLGLALTVAGLAVASMVTLSVAKFAEFDQGMSNVAAATMATTAEQEKLADAALDAGADTAYSAREAAAAEEELAKAGLTTSEIVGGSLNGALALAAAGQLEVARSAEIMATTLKQFRLPAEQASHVSDLLAAGAGKAQGSVDDLSQALQYVGPVAAGLNLGLEETVGTLALFASQGQIGERAGTGLRGVLMSLTAPSALAAKTMEAYNVQIFDGQGRMKSLSAVSQELKNAFGGLTEAERSAALGRIFGNEQITAARVLYEGGAKAVKQWTDEVNDSGYAAQQASMRQDNLAGDIEKLGGAFDTALIKTGSGANDVLRDMVQSVTALVDWYGELDPAVQGAGLTVAIATAAFLLFSGTALSVIGRVAEMKKNFDLAGMSMGKTALIAGGVGVALTGVITVVALLAQQQAEARAKAEAYADTLEEGTARVQKGTREMVAANLQAKQSLNLLGIEIDAIKFDSAADGAEKLGISMSVLTDAAMGDVDALREVAAVTRLRNRTDQEAIAVREKLGLKEGEFASAVDAVVNGIKGESASLEEAIELAKQRNSVTEDGATITRDSGEAYLDAASDADEYKTTIDELIEAMGKLNGVGQDAISQNLNYQDTLASLDETIQKAREGTDGYSLTLDTNTQAGRDNMKMLVELASDAESAAKAQLDLDGNTDNYRATLQASRDALIQRAQDLGYTADQAEDLANQILNIPSEKEIKILADAAPARAAINGVIQDYQGRTITLRVGAQGEQTYSRDGQTFYQAAGGHVKFFAGGGENHVAQFARAGDWRVWAEPETGGEWYFPEASSKRSRSLALAKQMVNGWGYDLAPAGSGPSGGRSGDIYNLTVQVLPGEDPQAKLFKLENDLRRKMGGGR